MKKILKDRNRQLLASEKGTVFKNPGGKINICLVYPNTYHVGMSNLGFTGLYTLLNARDDVVCERAFLPDRDLIREFIRSRTEIFAMESERPLQKFDVIGFSVSFENDYPHILEILSLANIKVLASERRRSDPLVIMGGPCAFMNPEPLADSMDAVFVGEAEDMLNDFIETVKRADGRKQILRSLSSTKGFYIPSLYIPRYDGKGMLMGMTPLNDSAPSVIKRRYVRDISANILTSCLSSSKTEFKNMVLIEAMRGCPFSCRFCAAGHVYNPPRHRDTETLKTVLQRTREQDVRIGLIAPSLSEYKGIKELLKKDAVHVSITSLRASRKSAEIMSLLKDKKSVSIAPEAGSQRLRNVVNKRITEDDIITTADVIFQNEIRTLKLYFMIGLPTETEDDIDTLIELVKKIRSLSRKGTVAPTLSPFVPKPCTPFQWHPMEAMKDVKEKIRTIKKGLSIKGVKVYHDAVRDSYMQGLFAIGDRRVGKVLYQMVNGIGLKKACTAAGIDPGFYLFRQKDMDEVLPWDFIDNGVSKKRLWDEYMKALAG